MALDQIMVNFGQLYYYAEEIMAQACPNFEEPYQIAAEASKMDSAFYHWASSQMDLWKPAPRGSLSQEVAVQSSYASVTADKSMTIMTVSRLSEHTWRNVWMDCKKHGDRTG